MLQNIVVGLIVAACALYATWALVPASWRRATAARLAGWPLPGPLRARFARLAQSAPGCGCNGCDTPAPKVGGAQPVRFVRKPR